jgi:IS605 OrfB family transposase
LNRELYHLIRQRFGLRSQMAQSVLRTVVARYKTILTNQNQWIKPKFRRPQLDLVWNRDYSLNGDRTLFSVNTLQGRIKVPFHAEGVDTDGRFGTAKLVYRHGKFFLHVPVTKEIDVISTSDATNVVGIDRGIRFLAVSYDSNGKSAFFSGAVVKQKRAHYKALRKELQQVRTPSSRRKLKAIGQRENRWMRDVNHCISKALVRNNPEGTLFVLEDLTGIRAATERVRVRDRYVSVSWAYYDLQQKLVYKALKNHQSVITVDPAYTSQTCPKCGHVSRANRDKKKHIFCSEHCGYTSNDDRIGAMNLHRMGMEYLVQCQGSMPSLAGSQSIGPDVTAAASAVTNVGGRKADHHGSVTSPHLKASA